MNKFLCKRNMVMKEDSQQHLGNGLSHCRFIHGYSLEFEFVFVQMN